MTLMEKLGSQVGLALDETILVMTMLSGFAGFVIVAEPFGSFGSGAAVEEAVNELTRIERANYEFYHRYLSWPHETTNGRWEDNAFVLQNAKAMSPAYHSRYRYSIANFLPEHSARGGVLQHDLGDGGAITQHVVEFKGESYLEVILEDVPYDIAKDVDEEIDGVYGPTEGRVNIIFENDKINLHYRANKV